MIGVEVRQRREPIRRSERSATHPMAPTGVERKTTTSGEAPPAEQLRLAR